MHCKQLRFKRTDKSIFGICALHLRFALVLCAALALSCASRLSFALACCAALRLCLCRAGSHVPACNMQSDNMDREREVIDLEPGWLRQVTVPQRRYVEAFCNCTPSVRKRRSQDDKRLVVASRGPDHDLAEAVVLCVKFLQANRVALAQVDEWWSHNSHLYANEAADDGNQGMH